MSRKTISLFSVVFIIVVFNSMVFVNAVHNEPEIHSVTFSPSSPYYDETVKVTALVYDQDDNMRMCLLRFTVNGGEEKSRLMFKGEGWVYSGSILSTMHSAGDKVNFWIRAYDWSDNIVESNVYSYVVLDDEYYEQTTDPVYADDDDDEPWDGEYDNSPPNGVHVNGTSIVPVSMLILLFAGVSLIVYLFIVRRGKK